MLLLNKGILNYNSNYLSILQDGNTFGWWIASDLATITKDGSNRMSRWNDYLGSGHDLIQAGADVVKPVWTVNGITFNGIQRIKAAAFTLNQPEFIYIVFSPSSWIQPHFVFDGNVENTGGLVQYGTSPQLIGYAGGSIVLNAGFTLGTYAVARLLLYGANSKLIINAGTPTTGNFGTANMGGFTVGSEGNDTGTYCYFIGTIKEIIGRKVSDASSNETVLYNYLKTKYSL